MSEVTIERLDKCDLCFEDINDEWLYDYNSLDDFLEETINELNNNCDPVEYINACESAIEKSKHLTVCEKDYFYFSEDRLAEIIQDYGEDNFGTSFEDYEVTITNKAQELIKELCYEINEHNKIYHAGSMVGFIDLSNLLKQKIEENN